MDVLGWSATPAPPVGGLRAAIDDTVTMMWRDLIRTARQPEMLVFGVAMGVFFLVLFNYVFGGTTTLLAAITPRETQR